MGVFLILLTNMLFILSSPFLFVLADDRVIHYTGADDITGDVREA